MSGGNKCDQCLRECMETLAVVYCYDCSEKLCGKCIDVHKKVKLLKSHKVLNIENNEDIFSQFEFLKSLTMCPEHPMEEVRYICSEHEQLCCNECAVVSHRKCYQMLSIAKEQTNLGSSVESISRRLREFIDYLDQLIEYEEQHKTRIATRKNELKDKLEDIKKKIDDAFYAMEKTIYDEFEEKSCLILNESKLQKEAIETLKSKVELSVTKMVSAKAFGRPLHLFLLQRILRKDIEGHENDIRFLNKNISTQIIEAVEQPASLEETITGSLRIETKCSGAKIPSCPGILKYRSWAEALKSSDFIQDVQTDNDAAGQIKAHEATSDKELDIENDREGFDEESFEQRFEDEITFETGNEEGLKLYNPTKARSKRREKLLQREIEDEIFGTIYEKDVTLHRPVKARSTYQKKIVRFVQGHIYKRKDFENSEQ